MPVAEELYPIGFLHSSGVIEVAENTSIYYEQRGNPKGPTVVYNHGGPGGFSQPENSRWFDPDYYNIILYDQRGTGQSIPSIKELTTDPKQFSALNIDDMVADLEKLRQHLNVSRWLVFGGSWGSTLSLYYAAKFPKHVEGLIIFGIFLNKPEEMSLYFDAKLLHERFPELGIKALDVLLEYGRSKNKNINPSEPESFVTSYYELCVEQNDATAQYLWTSFEQFNDEPTADSLARLKQIPTIIDPSDRTHAVFESIIFRSAYHGFNILDEHLLASLKETDIRIVQGDADTEAPPIFAQQLVDVLLKIKPNLWYRFIDGKHSANSSEAMSKTLLNCTNSFKQQADLLSEKGLFSQSLIKMDVQELQSFCFKG